MDLLIDRLKADSLFLAILQAIDIEGVDLTDEESFAEHFRLALDTVIPSAAEVFGEELLRRSSSMLCDWASLQHGFESRLRRRWARPFDRLRTTVVSCFEVGRDLSDEEQGHVDSADFEFEALRRIHGRACQTAWEVICLIESGYANGALTRWRTLHELAVVSLFILEHGQSVAERYLLHTSVDSLEAIKKMATHCEALGIARPADVDRTALERSVEALVDRFGPPFKTPYGWAADVLGNKRPTFAVIEESVAFDHMRPFFKLACHGVHAGPKGLYFNVGVPDGTPEMILAGASNTGFTDPAQLTAQSLVVVTSAFVASKPSVERLVMMHAVSELSSGVGEHFFKVQQTVESLPPRGRLIPNFVRGIDQRIRRARYWIRRSLLGR